MYNKVNVANLLFFYFLLLLSAINIEFVLAVLFYRWRADRRSAHALIVVIVAYESCQTL